MLVGPGGVGKSSLLRGLMKQLYSVTSSSTQLAETLTVKPVEASTNSTQPLIDDVPKPVSCQWVSDAGSFWKPVTDNDELMELVRLVHLVAKAFSGEVDSPRYIKMMQEKFPQSMHRMTSSKNSVEAIQREVVRDILSRAIEIAKNNPNAQVPLIEILLHLWDCGGQAVFLDILPAFLTPRTVFLSLYDASRELTDPCLIQSFKEGKVIAEQYHNATTVELLLEWMASIYAMLGTSRPNEAIPKYPRIIPVGTHGDASNVKDRKEEIISNLTHKYEDKAFAHLVKKGVIVDNTTAGKENEDPGFSYIRQQVHGLTSKELTVRTPVAWVLFRKVFHKVVKESKSPVVSLKLTREIAKACSIPEDEIPSMLKFYHDLAVFFHYKGVLSLSDQVIADPQWLVKEIARLLALEGFESVDNPALWKPLRETGILVQPLYEEVWKDTKLSSQSLMDLLVHFKIAVPIVQKEYKFPGKEYYVPCVLPFYRPETSASSLVSISGGEVVKRAAPLHLLFNTHHVPPGYFTRLATSLSSDPKCRVLFRHEAYCNRISILYGDPESRIDRITLTKQQYSVRIDLVRMLPRQSHDPSFVTTCRDVMKLIQNNSLSVLEWFPGVHVHMGFVCEICTTTEPKSKKRPTTGPENEKGTTTGPENEKGTTARPENEKRPTTRPENEKGTTTGPENEKRPTTGPENEKSPTTVPENEKGTTTGPEKEKSPTTVPENEKGTTTGPEKEKSPTTGPENEKGTTTGPENEKRPTTVPEKEKSPTTGPENEKGTTTGPEKEKSPTTVPENEKGTTTGPEKEKSPTTGPENEKRPTTVPEKEKSPTTGPENEKRPTTVPEKEKSPTTQPENEKVTTIDEHFVDISPEMSTSSRPCCTNYQYCPLDTAHQYWLKISPKILVS